MDFGLRDRTALVTGASAGLGYAAALALATEGVSLVINSRNEERIAAAAERIRQASGGRVEAVAGDLTTADGMAALEDALRDRAVDILVANAGGPSPGRFLELEDSAWEEAHRLVFRTAERLTRLVLPGMVQRRFGRLIYITSVAVLQPVDDLLLSNTYRAAVTGMCKTIANTYGEYGITANCVCPGYTHTERLEELARSRAAATGTTPEAVLQEFARQAPLRRLGRPEEIGAVITFLASEPAAFITGASIPVDGGLHRSLL